MSDIPMVAELIAIAVASGHQHPEKLVEAYLRGQQTGNALRAKATS